MQRTNRLLLDELEHSRRMTKSQGESVLNLHEQVEAARQQKRKLEEEYVAKLRRFNEESQQQMELDQRAIRLRTVGWWRTGRVTRLAWLSKTTDFGKRLQV
ncbi:unnamed protein product [Phytophthora lilii]|uniref:Unnamed protein product n=1 Tax=Phytophthora lilii TaxID=2077276 RepID=A0A9W6U8X3_9STRA|nr:unnamed protein product [Phytophthora lilii]